MKIGVTQYTAGGSGLNLLERARLIGLQAVEPMIAAADSEYLLWSHNEIEAFLRHANQLGIVVPTAAMAIFNNNDALVTSAGQDKAVKIMQRSLEFAAKVGAASLLVCTYFASEPNTQVKKAHMLQVLHRCAPLARDVNVAIALESPLPAAQLADVVDEVNSEFLGVYYDVGNALYFKYDPAAEIELLGRRILAVHIKDTRKELGDSHLGAGRLNLGQALQALSRIPYNGWLMLETPPGSDLALQNDIKLLCQAVLRQSECIL